jgi:endonuclease YncB( thermonuclease family)
MPALDAPRRTVLALVVALFPALLVLVTPATAHAADLDCSDFATQAAAQKWFLGHSPAQDPDRLDSDGDLVACESNPCPCLTSTKPVGTGGPAVLRQRARVVRVVDGDTVDVRLASGARRRVRMLGIDTPEVYGGVECGGPAASRALKRLLPVGTRVRLTSDPTQDKVDRYGRILRYVTKVSTGRDMDYLQVRRGHARVYVYMHHPFRRVDAYRAAQRAARAHHLGLWGAC